MRLKLSQKHISSRIFIPRITLTTSNLDLPFVLKRRQFPVRPAFAMTINKAQGQTMSCVGIYLPNPVFSHGQLYVACSRVTSRKSLKVLVVRSDDTDLGTNNVYTKILYILKFFTKFNKSFTFLTVLFY